MPDALLVFYGSYRRDRTGIRLAKFLVNRLGARGSAPELIDAQAVGLPMLDRMYKEHPPGTAPANMEALAAKIRGADGFVFVAGEYNWSVQPGLKNLTDHYLEEWARRPAAVASYSAGMVAGARAGLAWHGILAEMGMAVVPRMLSAGPVTEVLDEAGEPVGEGGKRLERGFGAFADDLAWWVDAARRQRSGGPAAG